LTGEPMHSILKVLSNLIMVWKAITLHLSTHNTAVWIKKCSKSTSVIKVATIQMTISITKGSHRVLPPNQHSLPSAKMNITQRKTLHCMYCSMPKSTPWTEATSNSEKLGPYIPLAVYWRHQSVIQLLSQSISRNSVKQILNSVVTFWKHFGSI